MGFPKQGLSQGCAKCDMGDYNYALVAPLNDLSSGCPDGKRRLKAFLGRGSRGGLPCERCLVVFLLFAFPRLAREALCISFASRHFDRIGLQYFRCMWRSRSRAPTASCTDYSKSTAR